MGWQTFLHETFNQELYSPANQSLNPRIRVVRVSNPVISQGRRFSSTLAV
jgi:hypothetical protein